MPFFGHTLHGCCGQLVFVFLQKSHDNNATARKLVKMNKQKFYQQTSTQTIHDTHENGHTFFF